MSDKILVISCDIGFASNRPYRLTSQSAKSCVSQPHHGLLSVSGTVVFLQFLANKSHSAANSRGGHKTCPSTLSCRCASLRHMDPGLAPQVQNVPESSLLQPDGESPIYLWSMDDFPTLNRSEYTVDGHFSIAIGYLSHLSVWERGSSVDQDAQLLLLAAFGRQGIRVAIDLRSCFHPSIPDMNWTQYKL